MPNFTAITAPTIANAIGSATAIAPNMSDFTASNAVCIIDIVSFSPAAKADTVIIDAINDIINNIFAVLVLNIALTFSTLLPPVKFFYVSLSAYHHLTKPPQKPPERAAAFMRIVNALCFIVNNIGCFHAFCIFCFFTSLPPAKFFYVSLSAYHYFDTSLII
jgi:hypothetical protein